MNKQFELGVSASNIFLNQIRNTLYNSYSNVDFQLFFQYKINLINGYILKPLTLIETDFKTTKMDVSAVLDYYGKIFAGFSVQMNNKFEIPSLGIVTGARINQNLKLYYSYDIDFSPLKNLHEGTHEIIVNYNLNKIIGKKGVLPIIYSPRNL